MRIRMRMWVQMQLKTGVFPAFLSISIININWRWDTQFHSVFQTSLEP